MKQDKNFLQRIKSTFASKHLISSRPPYTAFAIFAALFYVLPYLNCSANNQDSLPCVPVLRIITGVLIFFLVTRKYWPTKFKKYLSIYWYFCLLYMLSFLSSFMVLETNVSWKSLDSMLLSLFLLAVLVDWLNFVIITGLGITLAVLLYVLSGKMSMFFMPAGRSEWIIYMYGFTTIISAVFRRRKDNKTQDELEAMKKQGAYIAHETSEPLISIATTAQGLSLHLPALIAGYEAAKQAGVLIEEIPELQLETLKILPAHIKNISRASLITVDILLNQIKGAPDFVTSERCLVSSCIETALTTYPLLPREQALISWDKGQDFEVGIRPEMLLHILYNLIKNSLYQIKQDNRGDIKIWTEQGKKENQIHFKDTASGIDLNEIKLIFKASYTTKRKGNGLGLSFCKETLEAIGGSIICHSQKNQYMEFVLVFPRLEEVRK